MKYLVHFSFPYLINHSVVQLNSVQNLLNEGHDVDILLCGGGVNFCYGNTSGDLNLCFLCKRMQNMWLKILKPKPRVFYYYHFIKKEFLENNDSLKFDYESIYEIRDIKYKKVQIGYGALSSYVSTTRNLFPKIDNNFRFYIDNLLKVQCLVTDLLENYIKQEHPDKIILFNGRHFEVRPFYDFSNENNVPFECIELGISYTEDSFKVANFGNHLPHNIKNLHKIINEIWQSSSLPESEKLKIGSDFFEKRKTNLAAGGKVHTSKQIYGKLSKNWDKSKRNFVIFNSSEDEFFAVGDDFTRLSLFKNQIEGIKTIADLMREQNDIKLYLRIHPNLRDVNYSYHSDLYLLENEFSNLTVIAANDEVSTYSLIENAEKIITFGSSTGIEAVYHGKPSILLSGTLYYYMDVCYIPGSVNELKEMLLSKLEPKNSHNVLLFGFYILSDKGQVLDLVKFERTKYIPFRPLKINNESYWGLIRRFIYSYLITKLIKKNHKRIPTLGN